MVFDIISTAIWSYVDLISGGISASMFFKKMFL